MSRTQTWFWVLFFVVLGISAGRVFPANAQEGGQAPQAMPVKVIKVEPEKAQIWKDFSGRISAIDYVEIRPQVSGTITEVDFTDGQHVEAGDVLFVIDKRPYEAAVRKAEAALKRDQDLFALANKEMLRAKELIKTNALSNRVYDERKSARQVALSEIDAAKAALEQAKIDLDYATITAPVSGYTSRAEITKGNLVEAGPNAPILTTIVSDAGVYADFDVDEKTYLQYVHGAKDKILVKLVIPNLEEKTYDGEIHSFDNRIDPASGTIRARAFFDNEEKNLVPGMFVRIKMGSPTQDARILVPDSVIGTDQDRKFVMVVDDKNTAQYRPVTLGESTGGRRVILSGLKGGEKVITERLMFLRPGMPVLPQMAGQDETGQDKAGQDENAQKPPQNAAEEAGEKKQ